MAGLHDPKKHFFLAVVFERFFLLLTQREKTAFSQLKALISAYRSANKKKTLQKNRYFGACKPAIKCTSAEATVTEICSSVYRYRKVNQN